MARVEYRFGGMSNIPDANASQDGDMHLLANMRHIGGDIVNVPVCVGEEHYQYDKIYYHGASGKMIGLKGGAIYDVETDTQFHWDEDLPPVKSLDFFGNIVRLCYDRSISYVVWKNNDYQYIGELPGEAILNITPTRKDENVKTQAPFYVGNPENTNVSWHHQKSAFFNQALDLHYERGRYIDSAMFVAAVRLFDGTRMIVSPYTLFVDNTATTYVDGAKGLGARADNFYSPNYGFDTTAQQRDVWIRGQELALTIDGGFFKGLDKWADVIMGVDIFSTGSVMYHKFEDTAWTARTEDNGNITTIGLGKFGQWALRSTEDVVYDLVRSNFYLVKSYDITGKVDYEIENTSPSCIAVQTMLKDVFCTGEYFLPYSETTEYNNRLHIGGVRHLHSNGFSAYAPFTGLLKDGQQCELESMKKAYIQVKIEASNGEEVIWKEIPDFIVYKKDGISYLSPIITFPNPKAKQITIYVDESGSGEKVLKRTFDLTPGSNYAYYVNNNLQFIDYTNSFKEDSAPKLNEVLLDSKNIVAVSEVGNPFCFPYEYKFEGTVKAIASTAEDVSSGQFGQFPLNVFTSKGVWALAVDTSGKTAYSNKTPLSRAVCTGNVRPVLGGVVFPSDKSLMFLSGSTVTELAPTLKGEREPNSIESYLLDSSGVNVYIEDKFTDYLKGAKIGYNYNYNEIVVTNRDYGYSYIYSFTDAAWSVIDVSYDDVIDTYPKLTTYRKDIENGYIFNWEGSGNNAICAITRPIKVGTSGSKRVKQAALRGTWEGSLNFYVLGSNDGVQWSVMCGREFTGELQTLHRDLITGRCRGKSVKFIAIALTSENFKGRISKVELEVESGIDNKKLL